MTAVTVQASTQPGRVHLFYGLAGSGKSTLARELEAAGAVRYTLDEWMLRLYPGLAFDAPAYGEVAAEVKELVWSVARQVVVVGVDVLLDWNSWSRERRAWALERARSLDADTVVHVMTATVVEASKMAAQRAQDGRPWSHPISTKDNEHLATLMQPPSEDEGLEIVTHVRS